MEKVKFERKHDFYCDKCGKYLGTTYEHPDGWYRQLGEVEFFDHTNSDSTEYYGNLCNECTKCLKTEIRTKDIELFKKYGLKER